MTIQSVHLLPPGNARPRAAKMPTYRARRWFSLLEDEIQAPAVKVFVNPRAYVRICAHAGSDLENEVGGWLVGRWRVDRTSGAQFIVVEASLPAPHTRSGSAYLTFTQDTQVELYHVMQERFPKKELLGWYHTHPRMGVFLSDYDTWLHRHFFPDPYQVALVVEPHSATGGFFIRQNDGWLDPRRYYGFFELHNRRKRSVVHWRNVVPASERQSVDTSDEEKLQLEEQVSGIEGA